MSLIGAGVTIKVSHEVDADLDLSDPTDILGQRYGVNYRCGSSDLQVTAAWRDIVTISDSAVVMDLQSLTGAFGTQQNFSTIKGVYIQNLNSSASDIVILGGASSAPFESIPSSMAVQPGGCLVVSAPNNGYLTDSANYLHLQRAETTSAVCSMAIWVVGVV